MLAGTGHGAGGMMKAFRTIPVIGQIIEDMKELCPNAWLINFTIPVEWSRKPPSNSLGGKRPSDFATCRE